MSLDGIEAYGFIETTTNPRSNIIKTNSHVERFLCQDGSVKGSQHVINYRLQQSHG